MLYPIVIGLYILFVAGVVFFCHRRGLGWFGKLIVIIFLFLAPFWDMFLAKGIMWNYARKNTPLQEITRTIEKPESVLWIDNVWPGYDEYGRHWMVSNYLDGVHMKTLILNGDDKKLYLYHATIDDFAESEKVRPEYIRMNQMIDKLKEEAKATSRRGGDNKEQWRIIRQVHEPQLSRLGYRALRKKEVEKVFSRHKIYQSRQNIPPMNYRIELNQIRLSEWQDEYIWCDEIQIQDNSKNENIAFSKRCLGYSPKTGVNPLGKGSPFYGGARLGDERVYEFDDKVLFGYAEVKGTQWSRDLFEKSSYKGGALNWKSQQNRVQNDHE